MRILSAVLTLVLTALAVGCATQDTNTFKPNAYRNIRTWDVDFMFENAPHVTETQRDEATGKDVTVRKQQGQPSWALAVREDIYYCMLGKAGFRMAPKGTKADATVYLSFDSQFANGNIGIINLTVKDKNGEPLTRLKYENPFPDFSLDSRTKMVNEVVTLLVEEVNANK
jgi:hypothetical protein